MDHPPGFVVKPWLGFHFYRVGLNCLDINWAGNAARSVRVLHKKNQIIWTGEVPGTVDRYVERLRPTLMCADPFPIEEDERIIVDLLEVDKRIGRSIAGDRK